MSLVLFIFFGLILFLICGTDEVNARAKYLAYEKEHPPHKWQEEYLLACQYYQEYVKDKTRKNPRRDALIASRTDIYKSGFRPTVLGDAPMSCFPEVENKAEQYRFATFSIMPSVIPDIDILLKCRHEDDIHHPGIKSYLNYREENGWDDYCRRMDDFYFKLVDNYNSRVEQQISDCPYEMLHRVLSFRLWRIQRLQDYKLLSKNQFIFKYSEEDYEETINDLYASFACIGITAGKPMFKKSDTRVFRPGIKGTSLRPKHPS